jgi:hypothetical protein
MVPHNLSPQVFTCFNRFQGRTLVSCGTIGRKRSDATEFVAVAFVLDPCRNASRLNKYTMQHRLVDRFIIRWVYLIWFALSFVLQLCSCSSTTDTTLKLRERVIELEDERDAIQGKYELLLDDYKTIKREIRASIDLKKRLDDALVTVAELEEQSRDVAALTRSLEKCEFAKSNILVDLMLTESSFNELLRNHRDLERQLHKEDCSAIKSDLVEYRDQAEHCLESLKVARGTNRDLSATVAEQAARLQELHHIDADFIKASSDLDIVIARNAELDSEVKALEAIKISHATLERELASKSSMLDAAKNELSASKAALNGLLESLDSRLQFETLKEAHEKEILPFWLESLITRLKTYLYSVHARHVQPVFFTCMESVHSLIWYSIDQCEVLWKRISGGVGATLHPFAIKADLLFPKDAQPRIHFDGLVAFCLQTSVRFEYV